MESARVAAARAGLGTSPRLTMNVGGDVGTGVGVDGGDCADLARSNTDDGQRVVFAVQ